MIFQWLVALVAIVALIVTFYADALTGKKKHSNYFKKVQTPAGKAERNAVIPKADQYDSFYAKLNNL